MPRKKLKVSAETILVTALKRAEIDGWQNTRIHGIANDLGISLAAIKEHFSDADAIADAWFRKSLDAMLAPTELAFQEFPPKERLFLIIMLWLDEMAARKSVTVQMVRAKMYLGHPHHWGPLIFNLSRLVQWIREAAILDARGRQRQLEEIGLTLLIVRTFKFWGEDKSENQKQTRQFLRKQLEVCDRIMSRFYY